MRNGRIDFLFAILVLVGLSAGTPSVLLAKERPGSIEVENGKKALKAKNPAMAQKWFLVAAEKGNRAGQYQLAKLYLAADKALVTAQEGKALWGTDTLHKNDPEFNANAQKAFQWTRKSALSAFAPAQELLGELYEGLYNHPEADDIVIPVDLNEAALWYQLAAKKGNSKAKKGLERVRLKSAKSK